MQYNEHLHCNGPNSRALQPTTSLVCIQRLLPYFVFKDLVSDLHFQSVMAVFVLVSFTFFAETVI